MSKDTTERTKGQGTVRHTPGPWRVRYKKHGGSGIQVIAGGIDSSELHISTAMRICIEHATVKANANLIAASPVLFAACEEALAQFSYMLQMMGATLENEPYIGASSEVSSRMDTLHAALKLAKGKA